MYEVGFEFHAMGGPCSLRLAGPSESALQHAAETAMSEVRRIERRYSRYLSDSIVTRINNAAGGADGVAVDSETASLVNFASSLHSLSEGLFDITSGVFRRVWNFSEPKLPAPGELEAIRCLVGWHRVDWDGRSIRLPVSGMEIDFGGLGKEYAADRAAHLLRGQGVRHGFVNLGGDIRVIGPPPAGNEWVFGIRHPRQPASMVERVALTEGALATSGDYERCIMVDGVRYGHVLDPHTGWPVSHWQSLSVIAPTCTAAGSACTVAMLMGEAARRFLAQQRLSWLGVDARGRIHRS